MGGEGELSCFFPGPKKVQETMLFLAEVLESLGNL